ncbi:uncharacterized protein LOC118646998 [Monomorium pharaonis]|uniref:uncharacterized protein LOC118646998 n=1 Tax=Monomorium pharaonis TaxID=307658 RepID=UPI001747B8A2|nr:uncharacterized protein LOC118646998 [Monomorium pharaonis]
MTTAPTISSSNLCTQESTNRQEKVLKAIQQNSKNIDDMIINEVHPKNQEILTSPSIEVVFDTTGEEINNNIEVASDIDSTSIERESNSQSSDIFIEKENEALFDLKKNNKRINDNLSSNLKKQKTDKVTLICKKEIELANVKISHKIEMHNIKKNREEFINKVTKEKLLLEKKELQEKYKLAKFRAQKEM